MSCYVMQIDRSVCCKCSLIFLLAFHVVAEAAYSRVMFTVARTSMIARRILATKLSPNPFFCAINSMSKRQFSVAAQSAVSPASATATASAESSRPLSGTPLVPTIVSLQSVRARYRTRSVYAGEKTDDEEVVDQRDLKTKTREMGEFLLLPGLLLVFFYIGITIEPVLQGIDQWLGDKHRFDLGFSLVEEEGDLVINDITRLESHHIELRQIQAGPAFTRILSQLGKCSTVHTLSLVDAVNIDADEVLAALKQAPQIMAVNLRGGDGGFALPLLAALSTNDLSQVKRLALRSAEVDSQMVALLINLLKQNKSLDSLTVNVRLLHHSDAGRSILKALQHQLREARPDMTIECRVYQ